MVFAVKHSTTMSLMRTISLKISLPSGWRRLRLMPRLPALMPAK